MDEILHSNGRQAVPDAIPAEETAGGVREEGSSRQGRRPVLDALIAAGPPTPRSWGCTRGASQPGPRP